MLFLLFIMTSSFTLSSRHHRYPFFHPFLDRRPPRFSPVTPPWWVLIDYYAFIALPIRRRRDYKREGPAVVWTWILVVIVVCLLPASAPSLISWFASLYVLGSGYRFQIFFLFIINSNLNVSMLK
jgi:hypothetical protein